MGEYMKLDKMFSNSSSPSYFHILFLIAFLEEAFIRKTIIILSIKHIIITFINNNAVINNNLWNTRRPYFALQISHGHAKGFLRNL